MPDKVIPAQWLTTARTATGPSSGAPGWLAVAVGFEPTEGLHPHTLSRRAP